MSGGHVVVPVEPCPYMAWNKPACDLPNDKCDGCLGDGTRAVLADAVPVERWAMTDWWGTDHDHAWWEVEQP